MTLLHILFLWCTTAILMTLVYLRLVRNPVLALILFILNAIAFAFFLVILNLEFLAIVVLILYIGAVAVLFLFVIMSATSRYEGELSVRQYPKSLFFRSFIFMIFALKYIYSFFESATSASNSIVLIRPNFSLLFEFDALLSALYNNYFMVLAGIALLLLIAMVASIFVTLFLTKR